MWLENYINRFSDSPFVQSQSLLVIILTQIRPMAVLLNVIGKLCQQIFWFSICAKSKPLGHNDSN